MCPNEKDRRKVFMYTLVRKRPSLGNKSPYEMIPKGDEDWEWLMQLTEMDAIPADDVHLNPALLKH